jgi:hypothetical protein
MAKLVKITKLTMVYVDKYSFHGGHNIVALTFFTKERMKKWEHPEPLHHKWNGGFQSCFTTSGWAKSHNQLNNFYKVSQLW